MAHLELLLTTFQAPHFLAHYRGHYYNGYKKKETRIGIGHTRAPFRVFFNALERSLENGCLVLQGHEI